MGEQTLAGCGRGASALGRGSGAAGAAGAAAYRLAAGGAAFPQQVGSVGWAGSKCFALSAVAKNLAPPDLVAERPEEVGDAGRTLPLPRRESFHLRGDACAACFL
jgi:hypothetical protein